MIHELRLPPSDWMTRNMPRSAYTWERLAVGDEMHVYGRPATAVRMAACRWGKRHGAKLKTAEVNGRVIVWRVA